MKRGREAVSLGDKVQTEEEEAGARRAGQRTFRQRISECKGLEAGRPHIFEKIQEPECREGWGRAKEAFGGNRSNLKCLRKE